MLEEKTKWMEVRLMLMVNVLMKRTFFVITNWIRGEKDYRDTVLSLRSKVSKLRLVNAKSQSRQVNFGLAHLCPDIAGGKLDELKKDFQSCEEVQDVDGDTNGAQLVLL